MRQIYIGTGGYSDAAMYPQGMAKAHYLAHYAQHYDCVEVNSTFYAPLGQRAFLGMLKKAQDQLKFSLKLPQSFSHDCSGSKEQAQAFLDSLTPLREQGVLAPLLLQFPYGFCRNRTNRLYLRQVCDWFVGFELAIEFRNPSWHIPQVWAYFDQTALIFCNTDYPIGIGLPKTPFVAQPTSYLRLHGRNACWHDAKSAAERHDYRYSDSELMEIANSIAAQKDKFQVLYVYFQNTTNAHALHNITTLKMHLQNLGFASKSPSPARLGLFDFLED